MKKFLTKLVVGLAALSIVNVDAEACTIMLVTKGASADGNVFVSHCDDGFGNDPNTVFVPAKNHKKGSLRPVYNSAAVSDELNDINHKPHTKAIGHIPEVEHTYAYIDADYPAVNEHGLMLAECTDLCARLPEIPYKEGGGIFYASELGRVAMERCKTAREAIKLMGELVDEYGIYGKAKSMFVADKDEGWLFEMQPTPSGKGGLWIAEKIPDGHYSIAANQLRIHAIREDAPNQIFNPKLPQMLEELGWTAYDDNGNLDWVKSLRAEELEHPYYSMRRVWRGLDTVAPSQNFSPTVEGWDSDYYPLSVKPDKKLAITDVMKLYRDYYQGTEFDMTTKNTAGGHGSPYDYTEKSERAILTADTSYAYIAQVNDKLPAPVFWLLTNTALENPFVPFAVAKMPAAYNFALKDKYDDSKMFWASSQVTALSRGYWNSLGGTVSEAVNQSEKNSLELVESSKGLPKNKFAATLNQNALKVFDDWKNLYKKLLLHYDGGASVKYDEHLPAPDAPTKY